MKKKESFEKYIERVVAKYIPILLLQRHIVRVAPNEKDVHSYMSCEFTYPYLHAVIYFSDRAAKDFKEGRNMEQAIVHELCHIITDPFYSIAIDRYAAAEELKDKREQLTDHIANAFFQGNKQL